MEDRSTEFLRFFLTGKLHKMSNNPKNVKFLEWADRSSNRPSVTRRENGVIGRIRKSVISRLRWSVSSSVSFRIFGTSAV